MKKMFRLLENVKDYNTFAEVTSFEHVNGNQQDIYIRLVQVPANQSPDQEPLRYIPAVGSTVTFKFDNLDSSLVISRAGTMAFPNDDRSIFKVTLLATDTISGDMKIILNEGAQDEQILLEGRLLASNADSKRFFC